MGLLSHIEVIAKRFANPERVADLELMDLGLTRGEFDILQNSRDGVRDQMLFMADRFGISEKQLNSDRWRELDVSLACARCREAKACQAAMAGYGTFSRDKCPNAERYREMAAAG